jgi:hypothetical protein
VSAKIVSQIVNCPTRQRLVEVTCMVSGNWFNRRYNVVSCPAMYDAGPGCDLRCKAQLGYRPLTNHAVFGLRA